MIQLNYRDARPIYSQIVEGFRRLIVSGAIQADERLPSVRSMATELAINPNTIQRAYRELEAQGYIYSIPGKGSFTAPRQEAGCQRMCELKQSFKKITAELRYLGATREELMAWMEEEEA